MVYSHARVCIGCGHCKTLAPKWEVLGTAYAAHKDKITIAKMDATANDFPVDAHVDIKGFPTIKLFKAGTNEQVEFDGGRDVASFIKFMAENAVNKVEVAVPAEDASAPEEPEEEEVMEGFEELW